MNRKQTFQRTFAAMTSMLFIVAAMYGADYAKFREYAGTVGSISVHDETVFPDAQFRDFMDAVDSDKNGSLSLEEVKAYSEKGTMNCSGMGIGSLAGIEIFEELRELDCSNNLLTELDLSYNTYLTRVDCYLNQISGEKMDALIASLPSAENAILVPVDLNMELEKNIFTVAQTGAADQRGWTAYTNNVGAGVKYKLTLADCADNSALINDFNGCSADVTLSGRTLYKDGSWNSLCLPFDMTVSGSVLDGDNVQAMTLNTTTSNLNEGTLTLNFVDATSTTIAAGTPFLIKWDGNGESNVENPVFEDVTISSATNDVTVEGVLTFNGTCAPVSITDSGDKTKLYLGAANTLYYPDGEMTIGSHRAYFQLGDGLTAGDPASVSNASKVCTFMLNFGEQVATGITSLGSSIQNVPHPTVAFPYGKGYWFSIAGRRLSGKPTQRGVYIHHGKKVVIQ